MKVYLKSNDPNSDVSYQFAAYPCDRSRPNKYVTLK